MRGLAWRAALPALMLCLAAAGSGRAQEAAAPRPVRLAAEVQRKLGLTTQPLRAAQRAATARGYLRVLDAGPLAQLDADIQAAEAAAQASAAEAARTRALNAEDQAVSAKAAESARAQARADAARLALLRRRVGLEWGPGLARLSQARRAALVAEIAAGRAALVRIDAAPGEGLERLRGGELDLGPLGRVRVAVLGPARAADARLMSPGVIAEATGPDAARLSAGLTAPVTLPVSAPAAGVTAPAAALIRSAGRTWVYVRTGPESFLRRPVDGGLPGPDGLFVAGGLKPGEPVVTRGAAALFAAEANPGGEGGD